MANEFEIIDNPTSTPEAVSTGYQAQNTNLVSQRAGLDLSVVEGGVSQVTVKIAGPVDVNGVLYTCKTDAILTPEDGNGRYVIRLNGSGDELTPELTKTFGAFDASKNARYDASNYRILNWIIFYDGTNCRVRRFFTPEYGTRNIVDDFDVPAKTYITSSGTWTAPFSKYYEIEMQGKGGDGGKGFGSSSARFGGCGGGGVYGKRRIFIEAGDVWTATFSASSGGSLTFTDGSTTLSVQNGYDGEDNTSVHGLGGTESSGFSFVIPPDYGGVHQRRSGGNCFLGFGGAGRTLIGGDFGNGEAGRGYGSGGGGALKPTHYGDSTGGSGAPAVIIITG